MTIAPIVGFYAVIFGLPFIFLLFVSFTNLNFVESTDSLRFVGLDNYQKLFGDASLGNSLRVTLTYALTCLLLQTTLSLLIAEWLGKVNKTVMGLLVVIMVVPIFIPNVVAGLMWKLLLNGQFGVVPYYMEMIAPVLEWETLLSDRNKVLPVLAVIDTWQWAPFGGVLFYTVKERIAGNIYEAARVDGASKLKIFFTMTLPLLAQSIFLFSIFRFIENVKEFDKVYVLTGGGPGSSSEMISLFIWKKAFRFYDFGYSSAVSLITYLVIFVISYQSIKYISRDR